MLMDLFFNLATFKSSCPLLNRLYDANSLGAQDTKYTLSYSTENNVILFADGCF